MTDFDDTLRRALDADDAAFLKELERGEGLFGHIQSTFHGPMGWISKGAIAMAFIFSGLMAWTAWQAFHAESQRAITLWSAGFVSSLVCQGLIKIWLYNRANAISILRAVKRMEVQLLSQQSK